MVTQDPRALSSWLAEGFLFCLPGERIARLLDEVTGLAHAGSWLGFNIVNAATLIHPLTRPWIDMQARLGASPWSASSIRPAPPLFGYIATFLGASIFNVAEGIPLLPLQTLWVSFTMLSIQSVGLGYSKPAAGLMDRPPLPPSRPILTRALIVWLALAGLMMAIGTLSVITWADQAHGLDIARTMGMVTFALFILFFSIESKDERDSAFSLDTFPDKTFVVTTSGSFVLLILSTVLSIFQTVLKTARLDLRQWLTCTAVTLSIVVAAEIRKAVLRQTAAKAIPPAPPGRSHYPLNASGMPDRAEYAPAWQTAATAGRHKGMF